MAISISAAGQPVMRREAMRPCPSTIDQLTRLDLGRPAWNDSNSSFCDLLNPGDSVYYVHPVHVHGSKICRQNRIPRKKGKAACGFTILPLTFVQGSLSLSPPVFILPGMMKCRLSISSLP